MERSVGSKPALDVVFPIFITRTRLVAVVQLVNLSYVYISVCINTGACCLYVTKN